MKVFNKDFPVIAGLVSKCETPLSVIAGLPRNLAERGVKCSAAKSAVNCEEYLKLHQNNSKKMLAVLLFLAVGVFALPVGDPRTPDKELLSKIDIPIEQGVHELSVHAFIGGSRIDYPDLSGTSFSPGFGAAITYSYSFMPRWSLLVGGGIHLFNNRGTIVNDNFEGIISEEVYNDRQDDGKDAVRLYYQAFGYSETQWSLMFMVPLMLQYHSNETRNKALYYALGFKLGMPFAGAYEGKADRMSVCGYYPDKWGPAPAGYDYARCNAEGFGEGFTDLGFGEFGNISSHAKLKLGTAFFAAAELGVKWRIYNKLAVYMGVWLDWALNDVAIRSVTDQPFTWTPTKGYSEDHLTPKAEIDFNSRTVGRAIPMSVGFTVRFAFGAGDRNAEPDSVRWIREIAYRDSIIQEFDLRNVCFVEEPPPVVVEPPPVVEEPPPPPPPPPPVDDEREKRLADFNKRLAQMVNGLDDYKVTQTGPSDRAREKLDTAAQLLNDFEDLRLKIVGHTCDFGTHEANLQFGIQRATSAKNYLVGVKGIDPSRLEIDTKAETEPVVPNTSEANRRKNRRIQLEILQGAEHFEEETK